MNVMRWCVFDDEDEARSSPLRCAALRCSWLPGCVLLLPVPPLFSPLRLCVCLARCRLNLQRAPGASVESGGGFKKTASTNGW